MHRFKICTKFGGTILNSNKKNAPDEPVVLEVNIISAGTVFGDTIQTQPKYDINSMAAFALKAVGLITLKHNQHYRHLKLTGFLK